jgi:hypothetical protein
MNWYSGVNALLKSEWCRKRASSELMLLLILLFLGHFALNVNPLQQEATRRAWQERGAASEAALQSALEKQDTKHGQQIERIASSFDRAHKEAMDLAREFFRRPVTAEGDAGIGDVSTLRRGD